MCINMCVCIYIYVYTHLQRGAQVTVSLSIHLLIDSCCFHVLIIVDSTTVNMSYRYLFKMVISFFLFCIYT